MSEQAKYPYLAKLPRKVFVEGELHVTEYGRQVLESMAREAFQQRDELTEVGQLFGKPLYVRLDWRDPDRATYELEQIHSLLRDMFARAEGYDSWQAKVKEAREGQ